MRAVLWLMLLGATSCGIAQAADMDMTGTDMGGIGCQCPAVKQPHLIVAATGEDLGLAAPLPGFAAAFYSTVGLVNFTNAARDVLFERSDCTGQAYTNTSQPFGAFGISGAGTLITTGKPASVTINSMSTTNGCQTFAMPITAQYVAVKQEVAVTPKLHPYTSDELTIELR